MRVILDLCAGTGAWSEPYREAGYDVRRVDLEHMPKEDVRLMEYPGRVHGVLAAPPCTVFSYARNRYKPVADELRDALSIVDACLRVIVVSRPTWWALENPLNKLRTYLGEPQWRFRHYQYGGHQIKPSCLWGVFAVPKPCPTTPTKPKTFGTKLQNADLWDAKTPAGLARAFFEANP